MSSADALFFVVLADFFSQLPSQMSFLPYCVIKNRVLIFKKGLQNHFLGLSKDFLWMGVNVFAESDG